MNKALQQLISLACLIIINGSILYYVMYLEKDKCKCLIDWRQKYIKYYCAFIIAANMFVLLIEDNLSIPIKAVITGSIIVASLVFYYSLYTYVHQLNKDKCECATTDLKNLHNVLYYYSYIFYVQVALVILLIILSVNLSLSLTSVKPSSKSKKGVLKKNPSQK